MGDGGEAAVVFPGLWLATARDVCTTSASFLSCGAPLHALGSVTAHMSLAVLV